MGLKQEEEKKEESLRSKRREHAAKRLKLGFNDKGKEEVHDDVLELMETKTSEFKAAFDEKAER
jgi:hypothetical protein